MNSLERNAAVIVKALQDNGYTAYLAGGCVRDLIMGVQPHDFDIATNAKPEQVIGLFKSTIGVGKSFGVIKVKIENDWFEVATFRTDGFYADRRHPESVEFSDAETDARRRDFTINALFYDPISSVFHDFVDGRKDIEHRVVRCVGSPQKRFGEDPLRMLRAVRFSGKLEFNIEKETQNAIKENAPAITAVSQERIRDELTRILLESAMAGRSLAKMDDLELLPHILPEVVLMKGRKQSVRSHPEGDVFSHTIKMLDLMKTDNTVLAYSVLLHDIAKRSTDDAECGADHALNGALMAEKILKRLRFSGSTVLDVTHCIRGHSILWHARDLSRSELIRMICDDIFFVRLELHRLDISAGSGDADSYDYLKQALEEMEHRKLPEPWIKGEDLISLGIQEGPAFGNLIKELYDAQLNGLCSSKKELMKIAAVRAADLKETM